MNAEDTANNILVDCNAERDLLGDSGTTPVEIRRFNSTTASQMPWSATAYF